MNQTLLPLRADNGDRPQVSNKQYTYTAVDVAQFNVQVAAASILHYVVNEEIVLKCMYLILREAVIYLLQGFLQELRTGKPLTVPEGDDAPRAEASQGVTSQEMMVCLPQRDCAVS